MKRSPIQRKPKKQKIDRIPLPFSRPCEVKKEQPAVKVMRDNREICNQLTKFGRDEYHNRVRIMWERQGKKCGLQISPQCKERGGRLLINEAQFDHSYGRGMGGGKRSDAIVDEQGNPINMAVCCWCNSLKGSKPLSDFNVIVP